MTIKEKFEHLEEQPNSQVWEQIEKTLEHRARVRKSVVWSTMAVALAGLAMAGVMLNHRDNSGQESSSSSEYVAVNTQDSPVIQTVEKQVAVPPVSSPQKETYVYNSQNLDESLEPMIANDDEPLAVPVVPQESKTVTDLVQEKQVSDKVVVQEPTRQETVAENSTQTTNTKMPHNPPADDIAIWIPNAFIPNEPNNDANRRFAVVPKQGADIQKFKMYIYSRTGGVVFKSTNIEQGWDGTINGELQPTGAYVYVIEYYDGQREKMETVRGMVTLVR